MPQRRNRPAHWTRRIERANELAENYPFASQVLSFYLEIAGFQQSLQASLQSVRGNGAAPSREVPFRDSLDPASLLAEFPVLLSLVARVAPPALAQAAQELAREDRSYWEHLLSVYWKTEAHAVEGAPETHLFFARAALQPYAEYLAGWVEIELPRYGASRCPICTGRPVAGVLREEGHGAKRSLICSLCLTEWDFQRVLCPGCGEQQFQKLSVYTASQFEHVHVEACDTCKKYIKTVDLTKNGLAVPEVDELATIPLNLWAQENGYTKLEPNLLGM